MKWLKITLLIIQKIKPRQERQRRTPRHLRTSNNQRRRRNEVEVTNAIICGSCFTRISKR